MKSFSGKKALVIGGSGGIGSKLAIMLAESGAEVAVHGGHDSERFTNLIKILETKTSFPVRKIIYKFDSENFKDLPKSVLNDYVQRADILCICYGPFIQKFISEMTVEDWFNVSVQDYALPGYLLSSALSFMKERKWGRVLLFGGTGTSNRTEFVTNAAYAGAKTAVGTLVESASCCYAQYGITVNAVLPGFTETEYTDVAEKKVLAEKMPLQKLINAESVAKAGIFLLENCDLNGVLMRVDRGWSPFLEKSRK